MSTDAITKIQGLELAPPRTPPAGVDAQAGADVEATEGTDAALTLGPKVVSFVASVRGQTRSDVLMSMTFAERAADFKHDSIDEARDWYDVYLETLSVLGWTKEAEEFRELDGYNAEMSIDGVLLDLLPGILAGNSAEVARRTVDALKASEGTDEGVRVFREESVEGRRVAFQVGAASSDGGAISIGVGSLGFKSRRDAIDFLFIRVSEVESSWYAAGRRMTLNEELYAQVRSTVAERLGIDTIQRVKLIQISSGVAASSRELRG